MESLTKSQKKLQKAYYAEWYSKNKDSKKAKVQEYRDSHPGLNALTAKNWRNKHPEKKAQMRDYLRKWNLDNPGKANEYNRIKYSRDVLIPERLAKIRSRDIARRNMLISRPDDGTILELEKLRPIGTECFYCGKFVKGSSFHIEHMMPLSMGGDNTKTNLTVSCPQCNHRKNTKTAEEFLSIQFLFPLPETINQELTVL